MTDAPTAIIEADAAQIARFVHALFRYADPDSVVALRSFFDDASSVHQIVPDPVSWTRGCTMRRA